MMRATLPVVRDPRNRRRAVPIGRAHFHYVFANTVSRNESDEWHAKLAIPAPARVVFDFAVADFQPKSKAAERRWTSRMPIAHRYFWSRTDRDHAMPESVVYENFIRYRRSHAPTDFKVFHGRPHLSAVMTGWEDIADSR